MGWRLLSALRMLAVLTVLTGFLYPLTVTLIANLAFPTQAGGSLVRMNSTVVGSALLGQAMQDSRYFWPRPSATDYSTLPSGGSNWGPTSAALRQTVTERAAQIRAANNLSAEAPIPPDLLLASGSGLDPHISPDSARLQMERVVRARGFDDSQRQRLIQLVEKSVEPPQFGFLGEPRVNVLLLNISLDGIQ
jgi:K+-transporting ATPase ATPase C chain